MDSYLVDLGAALSTLNSVTIIVTMLAGVVIGIILGALRALAVRRHWRFCSQ